MRKRFKYTPYGELPVEYRLLLKQAEDAMQTAYNPYSNFFVGAALLSPSGDAVTALMLRILLTAPQSAQKEALL
ncbi:MAG: hypothetical protein AABX27_05375 [Nanoarchaeota archaeon]